MSDVNELLGLIKRAGVEAIETGKPVNVMFGTVTKEMPLEIFVDQQTILEGKELVLCRNVTDFETEISFDNPAVKQIYTTWDMPEENESDESKISFKSKIHHNITMYNTLKVGDGVILLRVQGGQRFVVLDRIGVVTE